MSRDAELVQAFYDLAPLVGDPPTDARRTRAARTIYEALRKLTIRVPGSPPTADERADAAQTVLLRLVQAGPRRPDPDGRKEAAQVLAFLRRALYNNVLDQRRKRSREPALDDVKVPEPEAAGDPEGVVGDADAAAWAASLAEWLVHTFVPEHGGQAAASRRRHLENMLAVTRGETTFDDLVRADCAARGEATEGEPFARGRERLYRAQRRTLEWLLATATKLRAGSAREESERLDALVRLARALARRRLDADDAAMVRNPGPSASEE